LKSCSASLTQLGKVIHQCSGHVDLSTTNTLLSNRLHEVTVGLLGNLCACNEVAIAATCSDGSSSSSSVSDNSGIGIAIGSGTPSSLLITLLTLLFTSTDSPTLIELFRVLHIGTCQNDTPSRMIWLSLGDEQVCERAHYLLSITLDDALQEKILYYLSALLYYQPTVTTTILIQLGIIDTIVELFQRGHPSGSSTNTTSTNNTSVAARRRRQAGSDDDTNDSKATSSIKPITSSVTQLLLTMVEVMSRDARLIATSLERLLPLCRSILLRFIMRHNGTFNDDDINHDERAVAAIHVIANLVRAANLTNSLSTLLPVTACTWLASLDI
jgi:hypothetical protein